MEHIGHIMGLYPGNPRHVPWLRRPTFGKYVARSTTVLRCFIEFVAAILLVLGPLVSPAHAQQRRTLPRHLPPAAAQLPPIDRLPGSTQLDLAIGLPLRNQEALSKQLQQIYDPASPRYRHYLTTEQFTQLFGPTEQDYQSVMDFARANGFTVTGRHPNRLLVDVNATVADIERAFHVTMRVYQHPTESRRFYAPDVEPSVDLNLPILDISGLNDYTRPHPADLKLARSRATAHARPATGSAPDGSSYMGYDFRAAYAPGVSLTGSGQTIGLVQFDGYDPNDIASYESMAGLPNVTLTNIYIDGFDGSVSGNGGEVEVSLDIEMSISMAPGLSKVILYEAASNAVPNDVLSRIATDNQARQISCSWGWGGGPDTNADQIFQEMAMQGQSFFAASGDSDAFITSTSTNFPADDPNLTSVGGTTLLTSGPVSNYVSEAAWNWGVELSEDGTGTGGGISTSYPIPSYQQGVDMSANGGSTTMRNVPDVALTADGVYVIADSGTAYPGTGGTSCAAPLWAAFTALVNQQAASNGLGPVGFINPAVYRIGTQFDYASAFNDITSGNNEWIASQSQFTAVAGYDLCTGWGTPTGSNLVNALARPPDSLRIRPSTGFTANGPVGGAFNITSQTYALSNAGTTSLSWSLTNTSPWLRASSTSGTLTPGGPAKTVTVSLNSAANSLASGIYVGTVRFNNLNSGFGQNRQVTLQVGQLIVQNGGFEINTGVLTSEFFYWNLTDPTAAYVDDGSLFITPYDGNYAAALGGISSVADLSQTLPTLTRQPYLLSFWLENVDLGFGTTPNEFLVSWNGTTISSQFDTPAFDWTYYQFVVVAATNNTVLQFGFRNDNAYFGLDDVAVTPIPGPVIQSVTRATNTISLTWSTVSGMVYQLQRTASLTPTNWSNVGGTMTASGSSLSASDPIGTATQRFYRALLVP